MRQEGHDTIRDRWNRKHPERRIEKKNDPGPLFHWTRLVQRLNELGFESLGK